MTAAGCPFLTAAQLLDLRPGDEIHVTGHDGTLVVIDEPTALANGRVDLYLEDADGNDFFRLVLAADFSPRGDSYLLRVWR